MEASEIGYRIRKHRILKDFTAKQMADYLSITEGAYNKIERGETDITVTRLEQISGVLGIEITQLLKDDSSVVISNNQNMTLHAVYLTADNVYFSDDKKMQELIKRVEDLESRKDKNV